MQRRVFLKGVSASALSSLAGVAAFHRPAEAFLFALVGRALFGYAARTVTANTLRATVGGISRPAAARYASAQSTLTHRGYRQQSDIALGLYRGRGAGLKHHFSEAAGTVAEDVVKHAMEHGFGLVGGVGTPYGSTQDVGMAAFPNHAYQETPILGVPDIYGLHTLGNFVGRKYNLSDHDVTVMTYPLEMYEYPEYNDFWNSTRPSVFRSGYSRIHMRAVNVGTDDATVICRMVELGSGRSIFEDAMPLPPALQTRWR